MELTDALRLPLAPSEVWAALGESPLLRASLENCESFERLPSGEYAITLTVPVGPLRARYEVRAHLSGFDNASADTQGGPMRRTINFKACAAGVGSLRGQLEVAAEYDATHASRVPADAGHSTRIDYSIWTTLTGPLAELPPRQIENALHALAEDFFAEFAAVVEAKYGRRPSRAGAATQSRRQHVFLRPITVAGLARRPASGEALDAGPAGRLDRLLPGHRDGHGSGRDEPRAMPPWAWAAALAVAGAILYLLHRFQ